MQNNVLYLHYKTKKMTKFKFLFNQNGGFYDESIEDLLPSLEDTKLHFIELYLYYSDMKNKLDKGYKQNQKNIEIVYGKKGKFKKLNFNYNELHSEFQLVNNYYSNLLTATIRKYSFWLNDLLNHA